MTLSTKKSQVHGKTGYPRYDWIIDVPASNYLRWAEARFIDLIISLNDHDTKFFLSACYRYFVSLDKTQDVCF